MVIPKRKRTIQLTKAFMDQHGKNKNDSKLSWNEYILKLERGEIK